ncbi:MAG: Mbov_0395 family pilin-like conjugal transfer protein [Candidatus Dojkabacteria bacterium]
MKYIKTILLSISPIFLISPVYAADDTPPRLIEMTGVLDNVLQYIFPLAGLICVIFVVIGGYMWMMSAGDPSKVKQAQGTLTWAIIGLVFLLVVFAILRVLVDFVMT